MHCEFDYCIYNDAFTCILDEIQMNVRGMCEECEMVAISEKTLEEHKKKRLKEIAEIWEKENE